VPTILTGPAASVGSGQWGGKRARGKDADAPLFDFVTPRVEHAADDIATSRWDGCPPEEYGYADLARYAVRGAGIVAQLPHRPEFLIAEVETMRGCAKEEPCSFCTEHLKYSAVSRRPAQDILSEVRALSAAGLRNIRLGKQSCIYSYGSAEELSALFGALRAYCDVLHIDNVNPLFVTAEKTKALVRWCTEGNVASMGVESFDPEVIRRNSLGTDLDTILHAVQTINRYGAQRGANGMPLFLPGINLLFGLDGESKRTHEHNRAALSDILNGGLLLRRINIREVVVFPETPLYRGAGTKYLKKNRTLYWKWRNDIRQSIDSPMLARVVPTGTELRRLRTEVYDGNTTFARQVGTYPLVVGIKGRLGLDRFVDVRVEGHMLRSVTGTLC
jgi:radical SAM superfamily enzyme with C-terminal helix-hairpin-helix motif